MSTVTDLDPFAAMWNGILSGAGIQTTALTGAEIARRFAATDTLLRTGPRPSEWPCSYCDSLQPLPRTSCSQCGAPKSAHRDTHHNHDLLEDFDEEEWKWGLEDGRAVEP